MRGRMSIVSALIATLMATAPAMAQVPRYQLPVRPQIQMDMQQPPPQIRLPRQQRLQQIKPKVLLIPPSVAAQIAMSQNPGAQLLKIVPRGNNYVATLRQGNQVFRVRIPGN